MILSGKEILHLCSGLDHEPMIEPAVHRKVTHKNGNKIVSYGLQGSGYDIRLASVYINDVATNEILDPKQSQHLIELVSHEDKTGRYYYLYPGVLYLGVTVESFCMPTNIRGTCEGKSTYARFGILVAVTPLEPGWGLNERQYLTLEISNLGENAVKVYANEGIAQIKFERVAHNSVYNGNYGHQTEQVPYAGLGDK